MWEEWQQWLPRWVAPSKVNRKVIGKVSYKVLIFVSLFVFQHYKIDGHYFFFYVRWLLFLLLLELFLYLCLVQSCYHENLFYSMKFSSYSMHLNLHPSSLPENKTNSNTTNKTFFLCISMSFTWDSDNKCASLVLWADETREYGLIQSFESRGGPTRTPSNRWTSLVVLSFKF